MPVSRKDRFLLKAFGNPKRAIATFSPNLVARIFVGKVCRCQAGLFCIGMGTVMKTIAAASAAVRERISLYRFYHEERGVMAFFVLGVFILMMIFGGIAVDVMRFESRRVALQQTMDRAALASASIKQQLGSKAVFDDYFAKANLDDNILMVEYSTPQVRVTGAAGTSNRMVEAGATVTSHNFFMNLMGINYLQSSTTATAQQGVSQIEVMLVLDVSGSMRHNTTDGVVKMEALRTAAERFVTTIKNLDTYNQVSIGIVPYNSQVNIPSTLRNQLNVTNVATYDGVANAGFPNANCVEFDQASYTTTGLPMATPQRMAAIADTEARGDPEGTSSVISTTTNYVTPTSTNAAPANDPLQRICNPTTNNEVSLPSLSATTINNRIRALTHGGYTSISLGMRWGVGLLDQTARPIYSALISGQPNMVGRPADNTSTGTRKIIVLMTDGQNDDTRHIVDAFKTGPSPIWRGADGNYAIRFTTGGQALTGNARPSTACTNGNTYFVNHLKPNTSTACNSAAWRATPSWTDSGTVRQLDWSEVWRYLSVDYVARQLYGRSNVTGVGYSTVVAQFRAFYINDATLNSILDSNCTAAKDAGIEVYGIAFAAPTDGQTVINNCASSPKANYYFNSTNSAALDAAFQQIATNISELRLTQ